MLILEQSDRFKDELEIIINFIALDSTSRALEFFDNLIAQINNIPSNPYIYRKRLSTNDETIRELIFKGYTIPFYIHKQNNKIIILGIFNQNIWE
jgi:plasmid stabilization system protein ParE